MSPPAEGPRTLPEALAAAAAAGPGLGLVLVDLQEREESLSWAGLQERAALVAAGLRALGVVAGDAVAIVLPTGRDFPVALFGCLLAGAVPAPLYPPVRLGRLPEYGAGLARQLSAIEARLVISGGTVRRLLGRALAAAGPPLGCRTVEAIERTGRRARAEEEALRFPGPAGGSWTATPPAPAPRRRSRRAPPAGPDSTALIQFSSGTTAEPRPVVLSHRNLLWQCAALRQLLAPGGDPPPVGVSWLPLYHDMGLIGALLSAVCWPGKLVLLRPEHFLARPALWLRAVSRHRATISPAPGFALGYCARRIRAAELAGCDLSSWRALPCGAEPLSASTLEAFASRFAAWGFDRGALAPAYGLAEATLAVTIAPPGRGPRPLAVEPAALALDGRIVAARGPLADEEAAPDAPPPRVLVGLGPPLPGVEVEIRDAAGGPLPEGRAGRIHVRSPAVTAGYFGRPDLTGGALRQGWLDTGDLGFMLGGELHVCGRAKDTIVLRGANHDPHEFEESLRSVPGARDGGAVAVGHLPPGEDGERLLLLIERERGLDARHDPAIEATARRAVREATGIEPHTVRLLAAGTLPRTSSGKLRRQEALRLHTSGELRPPPRAAAAAAAAEMVRSVAAAAGFSRGPRPGSS